MRIFQRILSLGQVRDHRKGASSPRPLFLAGRLPAIPRFRKLVIPGSGNPHAHADRSDAWPSISRHELESWLGEKGQKKRAPARGPFCLPAHSWMV